MATRGGYMVLANYNSSSSNAVYEVRRGGDGVLYCAKEDGSGPCMGWLGIKNRLSRAGSKDPPACKHMKDYVAHHPGTVFGPPGRFHEVRPTTATPTAAKSKAPKLVAPTQIAPPPPTGSAKISPTATLKDAAPANDWRRMLFAERTAAQAKTPAAALAAFDAEIVCVVDLQGPAAVDVASNPGRGDIDLG